MALIKSISGIRGTIGGTAQENLTPPDITKFTAAYGSWLLTQNISGNPVNKVVIGRDGRISGPMVKAIVVATLNGMGIDVIDTDLSTTPTVEMAVTMLKADGGIILTASHNPREWNALKLLNHKGEFISAADGAEILRLADNGSIEFAHVEKLGKTITDDSTLQKHIDAVLAYSLVNREAISAA